MKNTKFILTIIGLLLINHAALGSSPSDETKLTPAVLERIRSLQGVADRQEKWLEPGCFPEELKGSKYHTPGLLRLNIACDRDEIAALKSGASLVDAKKVWDKYATEYDKVWDEYVPEFDDVEEKPSVQRRIKYLDESISTARALVLGDSVPGEKGKKLLREIARDKAELTALNRGDSLAAASIAGRKAFKRMSMCSK